MNKLNIDLCGIKLKNPVLTSPGPNVRNSFVIKNAIDGGVGGIVSKTISINPAEDKRPTIKRIFKESIMNCETWSEISYQDYIEELLKIKKFTPLIVSLGYKKEVVGKIGKIVEKEVSPDGYEFSTHYVGKSALPIIEIAKELKNSVTDKPIFIKISPNTPEIQSFAEKLSPFVDGFVAINSFGPVLDFDPVNLNSNLGSSYGQGWLSGNAILPLGLRIVYEITDAQDKPVIGVGGISTGIDAVKYFMVGAEAVGVCSAAIINGSKIYGKIAKEIEEFLNKNNYSNIEEIKNLYKKNLKNRKQYINPKMNIDKNRCIGCKVCISHCIQEALTFNEKTKKTEVLKDRCIGCGFCRIYCKFNAMKL